MAVQASTADFDPPAFVIMQKRSMFVLECAGEAVVSVLRLGSTEEPCEVDFETGGVGGHKATDADFVAVNGTLKFAAGQRSAAIRVPIKDDAHWEPMEFFEVRLLAARSAELGGNATTLVHIVDDDTYPEAMPPRPSAGRLVWAVIRERWRSRGKKPYQAVFFNQYDTLHKLAGTYAPLLIIELELAAHPWALFVVAAAYLASALYMWYSKWKFEDAEGGGAARRRRRRRRRRAPADGAEAERALLRRRGPRRRRRRRLRGRRAARGERAHNFPVSEVHQFQE